MLVARYTLMTVALALVPMGCSPMGCSGEDPSHDDPAVVQMEGMTAAAAPAPTPGASIYGTWAGDVNHADMFEKLVLMSDGRYHGERNVKCVKAPCPAIAEDGDVKFYTRETATFFVLTASGTGHQDRYEYKFSTSELKIRPLRPGSEFFAMARSNTAWCATGRDCVGQVLPQDPCAGTYECTTNACVWKCSTGGAESVKAGTGSSDAVTPPQPDQRAEPCPPTSACVLAAKACNANKRDEAACKTDAACLKCNPDGLLKKPVPDPKDPHANPVLKQP